MITRRTALEATIAAVLAGLISLIAISPALQRITTAWGEGDMLSTYVNAANWGWLSFERTTQFGYPFGMDLNLFPTLDITQNAFAAAINMITGNPFIGINLLLALSFPLVAALAYVSIRLTGLHGPLAIALAVAFSIIPYHFGRGLGHTYLATLYAAVTGVILAQLIGMGRIEHLLTDGTTRWRVRNAILLGILILITAWSGVYYAAFGLLLMAAAVLYRIAQRDSVRQLAWSVIPPGATAVLALLGALPAVLGTRGERPFAVLFERTPYESVIFAGNLAMAALPAPISRLPFVAAYNTRVNEAIGPAPVFENISNTNFGTWITFIALVGVAIALFTKHRKRLGLLAVLGVTSVLFFIPWGANYIFAVLVTPQIRAWNRLLPILLLLIILAAATVLARMPRAQRTPVAVTIAALIVAVSAIEVAWPFRTAYAQGSQANGEVTNAAIEYTSEINSVLPQNCGILQLPHQVYPENGSIREMNDYEHFWTSLVDEGKSWSYGAVKNTQAGAWLQALPEVPNSNQIDVLAQAGFCGIHLDTRAFVTPAVQRISADLTERYGPPAVSGYDDAWLFWITDANAQATPASQWSPDIADFFLAPAITPVRLTVAPRGSINDTLWWWTIAPEATFTVSPISEDHPLTMLSGEIRSASCGPNSVLLSLKTSEQTVRTRMTAQPDVPTPFTLTLREPSATPATLTISSDEPACEVDGATQFVQVLNPQTN